MPTPTIKMECLSNVVSGQKFRDIQLETINNMKVFLENTYGPMGSYTGIITGSNKDTIGINYSKDGLKVLKNIVFNTPIEFALQSELRDICEYVEKKVGDGTTSAVILSALIYTGLYEMISKNDALPPRVLTQKFQKVVDQIKSNILQEKRNITLDDIYDICMISTNGNESVSSNIRKVYEEYGFDVSIDLNISNDQNTKIKEYDGLTINSGYSDAAYINNFGSGTVDIPNPEIFSFEDPVDTPEMIKFMEQILLDNILIPASKNEQFVPTVIICPMITRDGSGVLNTVIESLYQFDAQHMSNRKPPVVIVTNISGSDEAIALDIAKLCNCKSIKKYINPELQKADQESGQAPTLETIHNFAGTAEFVQADLEKTKFVNPDSMKDGSHLTYDALIKFIESELKRAQDVNEDSVTIGILKKRLRCLKANAIEYYVGGISISDRESLKDLVEDAIKNCKSAAENGVGYAANYEGLIAAIKVCDEYSMVNTVSTELTIAKIIRDAYMEAVRILYRSVNSNEEFVQSVLDLTIERGMPVNIMEILDKSIKDLQDNEYSGNVLCSIMTDIEILNAISKIITMMVTSNQCLLQNSQLNRY